MLYQPSQTPPCCIYPSIIWSTKLLPILHTCLSHDQQILVASYLPPAPLTTCKCYMYPPTLLLITTFVPTLGTLTLTLMIIYLSWLVTDPLTNLPSIISVLRPWWHARKDYFQLKENDIKILNTHTVELLLLVTSPLWTLSLILARLPHVSFKKASLCNVDPL